MHAKCSICSQLTIILLPCSQDIVMISPLHLPCQLPHSWVCKQHTRSCLNHPFYLQQNMEQQSHGTYFLIFCLLHESMVQKLHHIYDLQLFAQLLPYKRCTAIVIRSVLTVLHLPSFLVHREHNNYYHNCCQ